MDNDSPISASARAKIRIRIKGVDYRMADQTAADIIASVAGTGARISGPFPLPSQVEEPRTALREEIRSHRRLIEIIGSNQKTVDAFRRHNVPAGVEIAIVAPEEPVVPDPAAPPAKRNRRHDSRVVAMHDFIEGVRALIIDKDNSPKWDPPTPEAVADDWIDAIFAPLPENEKWTPLT